MSRDADGYTDLSDYAVIGDGRTVALVADDGRIDWLPIPDLDSAPVFAALLDADHGGSIALAPAVPYRVQRSYVEDTNVLQTTYYTDDGVARVVDSLNTGVAGRLPWAELARRIQGISGHVPFHAAVSPGTCLNTAAPWVEGTVHGSVLRVDGLTLGLRTLAPDSVDVRVRDRTIDVTYTTAPGSRHLLALVATDHEPLFLPTPEHIDGAVDLTVEGWRRWSQIMVWDGPWAPHVRRSTLLLKLLIHAPTGSVAAAATTSLPESEDGGKNWDYRFSWVRDAAFTLTALFTFGLREEVHAAMSWLLTTMRRDGEPSVFYRFDGQVPPTAVTTHDVPGWRERGPVVSGNGAADQRQLGVFGDLFSIVGLYVEHGNVLDAATGRQLAEIADLACDQWRSKDAGMWELEDLQHYVTSKMGCWQALTKAVELADMGQIPGPSDRWRDEAERIREWVDRYGWSESRQAYLFRPGSDDLDASVLLHAVSGFDRGERMSRTLTALIAELGHGEHGDHLYRYSGVAAEEHTFVACSFWLVSALALCGRREEALARFERLLAVVPDTGVLTEMYDPADGSWWGNLPQALSHLALLNAAATLVSTAPDHPDAAGRDHRPG